MNKIILLMCINDYIMDEKVDIKKINNFDIIFNKMKYDSMSIDMMLFYIWNREKHIIKNYPKKDCYKIIENINNELSLINNDTMIEVKLIKVKAILNLV